MLSTTETEFLGLKLRSRMILAPLAGVSDGVYRYLCHREGAALTYTEMISAKGLYYKSSGTAELFGIDEKEGPVGLQLFGSEPEMIAYAVKALADNPNAIFDLHRLAKLCSLTAKPIDCSQQPGPILVNGTTIQSLT